MNLPRARLVTQMVILILATLLAPHNSAVSVAATQACAPSERGRTVTDPVEPAAVQSTIGKGYVLTGTVKASPDCKPIPGARLIVWLANATGEYTSYNRATLFTDVAGSYQLTGNFPGRYEGTSPHIHMQVSAAGYRPIEIEHRPRVGSTAGTFDIVLAVDNAARTTTSTASAEQHIAAVVDAMQAAIRSRDQDRYLAHMDFSDPVFALEHTRFIVNWAERDVVQAVSLAVGDLTVNGNTAFGEMTVNWTRKPDGLQRIARFPVEFRRYPDGNWRYAGEQWVSTAADHFVIKSVPGQESRAAEIAPTLPQIYNVATAELGFVPQTDMQIKLYTSMEALVATIQFSLPNIAGWNEPGEALKLHDRRGSSPTAVIAHEFAHFLTFEMAGTAHGRAPWWLEEGIAVFVQTRFEPEAGIKRRLAQVREWALQGKLAAWDEMSDFEQTPEALWRNVYPQGFAMIYYVTETYGKDRRNAWIRAMVEGKDIGAATQATFDISFATLSADFETWIKQRTN